MLKNSRLQLHIPQPSARPGEIPDFSYVNLEPAGACHRPPPHEVESKLRNLPFGLVRVLDDDDDAVGPWNPNLSEVQLKHGLRTMVLTRAFDDRMFKCHRQGKTSFFMKSTGEEALSCRSQSSVRAWHPATICTRVRGWRTCLDGRHQSTTPPYQSGNNDRCG